ncbi:MAG: 30S ribosomal protein S17e [Candidatus Woesearchaeota archaeon]
MGRIKTQLIKRTTLELVKAHRDRFTTDFEKNKLIVAAHLQTSSKKIRNVIAGYVTRIMKKGDAFFLKQF